MFNFFFFFFNDTATTEIYTLSLHDALPICDHHGGELGLGDDARRQLQHEVGRDRKSTRLNSSHLVISYAVFCLKKKKKTSHNSLMKNKTNPTTHVPLSTHTSPTQLTR